MFADFPAPPPPADIRFEATVQLASTVSSEPADFSNRLSLPVDQTIAVANSGDAVTWPNPNPSIASNTYAPQPPAIALLPREQTTAFSPSTPFDFSPIWPTNKRFYSVPERFLITQSRDGQTAAYSLASTMGIPIDTIDTIEVFADRQEYDQLQNLVNASGDVLVNFANSILAADELEVDLNAQLATANGNVVFTRQQQIVKGEKFEYRFGDNSGTIYQAKGELSRPNVLNANPS
ncbi:MAG: hypothetical protein HC796_11535, partial [Synechococcaceae cyanobacterium RL_1_2]|nr:hypothetical protein [Synechococcaceae cyanobacterium RL_1_2]